MAWFKKQIGERGEPPAELGVEAKRENDVADSPAVALFHEKRAAERRVARQLRQAGADPVVGKRDPVFRVITAHASELFRGPFRRDRLENRVNQRRAR